MHIEKGNAYKLAIHNVETVLVTSLMKNIYGGHISLQHHPVQTLVRAKVCVKTCRPLCQVGISFQTYACFIYA